MKRQFLYKRITIFPDRFVIPLWLLLLLGVVFKSFTFQIKREILQYSNMSVRSLHYCLSWLFWINDLILFFGSCVSTRSDLKHLLSISLDGPNMNFRFFNNLQQEPVELHGGWHLVSVGSCGRHSLKPWNLTLWYHWSSTPRSLDLSQTSSSSFPRRYSELLVHFEKPDLWVSSRVCWGPETSLWPRSRLWGGSQSVPGFCCFIQVKLQHVPWLPLWEADTKGCCALTKENTFEDEQEELIEIRA